MPRKYSFPEPGCSECQYHRLVGDGLLQTRYCGGFPGKKRPRRFSKSDPKFKAPKWCPRRLRPSVCRIYSFADEQSREMDELTRCMYRPRRDRYISVSEGHYTLRHEMTLPMKANDFFKMFIWGDTSDFLMESDLQLGDIIEVDDGLKPYYFYCSNWSRLVPVCRFDRTRVQKGE